MKRRLKLSTQIGLAIVAVGVFELLLVVGVVMVRLYVLDQSWLNGLDEPTRQAVHLMDRGERCPPRRWRPRSKLGRN